MNTAIRNIMSAAVGILALTGVSKASAQSITVPEYQVYNTFMSISTGGETLKALDHYEVKSKNAIAVSFGSTHYFDKSLTSPVKFGIDAALDLRYSFYDKDEISAMAPDPGYEKDESYKVLLKGNARAGLGIGPALSFFFGKGLQLTAYGHVTPSAVLLHTVDTESLTNMSEAETCGFWGFGLGWDYGCRLFYKHVGVCFEGGSTKSNDAASYFDDNHDIATGKNKMKTLAKTWRVGLVFHF